MKIHKQAVLIEGYDRYIEVISFYDTVAKNYGADIYDKYHLAESVNSMLNEPSREHLISLGYNFLKRTKEIE